MASFTDKMFSQQAFVLKNISPRRYMFQFWKSSIKIDLGFFHVLELQWRCSPFSSDIRSPHWECQFFQEIRLDLTEPWTEEEKFATLVHCSHCTPQNTTLEIWETLNNSVRCTAVECKQNFHESRYPNPPTPVKEELLEETRGGFFFF